MKRPGFLKRGERIRLQSFLARSGVSSRRAAEEMITHGRIAVNGKTVTAMGVQVVPGVDRVDVDGEEVKVAPTTWLALHKPTGYVTTRTDPFGRDTVYDLLPEKYHGLFHVGRLDRDSEGLLLLTNDGDLANRFLHPSFGITKEYDVIVAGKPSDAVLRQLTEGVELEDGIAKAESAKLVGPAGNGQSRVKMVLREGKKREVRRMLAAVGHEVTRLVRRRFGPIDLAELPPGKWRIVAPEELAHVREPKRPAREEREARDPSADEESPKPRAKGPAHATHNAYGETPGKRHGKPAAKGRADAPPTRAVSRDEEYRPRTAAAGERKPARPGAKSARPAFDAYAPAKKRPASKSAPPSFDADGPKKRPAGKSARASFDADAPVKKRPAAKSARPAFDDDAPPRKRSAAPSRVHAAGLEDWADRPQPRADTEDRARGPRPGARDDRPPRGRDRGEERRPPARGKPGPRDRAAGGFDREDRPAGPRRPVGGDDRPPRDRDRDEERRPPARGKPGPRDRAAGGFGREERPAGPRGRTGGDDRPPRDRDRGDERRPPARGKPGPRDRAAGGFDREERAASPRGRTGGDDRPPRDRDRGEERPAGPRGRTPDREGRAPGPRGRDEGPAPRGRFDREERGGGARGVRPPSQRDRTSEIEPDELDEWGTAPRRPRGPAGGARGGAPARGGRPSGGRSSGGKSGGRKPGGKPGGGKPGGSRGGPGKPRKPGGGGKPRGR
jgi:23S rRNA pseudouridine2605 synthase